MHGKSSAQADASTARMRLLPRLLLLTAAAGVLWACAEEKRQYVANVSDKMTPTMVTDSVVTFISDSGYMRYRITTPKWQMFEDAADPFWNFPNGLELRQYDNSQHVRATLVCDSARFLSAQGRWILTGHVVAVNAQADSFLTQRLEWDRNQRSVQSDSFVRIVREDYILEGYGFKSDEQMEAYNLHRPTGIIPVSKPKRDSTYTPPQHGRQR